VIRVHRRADWAVAAPHAQDGRDLPREKAKVAKRDPTEQQV
jgi:hypothetical protein